MRISGNNSGDGDKAAVAQPNGREQEVHDVERVFAKEADGGRRGAGNEEFGGAVAEVFNGGVHAGHGVAQQPGTAGSEGVGDSKTLTVLEKTVSDFFCQGKGKVDFEMFLLTSQPRDFLDFGHRASEERSHGLCKGFRGALKQVLSGGKYNEAVGKGGLVGASRRNPFGELGVEVGRAGEGGRRGGGGGGGVGVG